MSGRTSFCFLVLWSGRLQKVRLLTYDSGASRPCQKHSNIGSGVLSSPYLFVSGSVSSPLSLGKYMRHPWTTCVSGISGTFISKVKGNTLFYTEKKRIRSHMHMRQHWITCVSRISGTSSSRVKGSSTQKKRDLDYWSTWGSPGQPTSRGSQEPWF